MDDISIFILGLDLPPHLQLTNTVLELADLNLY